MSQHCTRIHEINMGIITRPLFLMFIYCLILVCRVHAQAVQPLPDTLQSGDSSVAYPQTSTIDESQSTTDNIKDSVSIRFVPDSVLHRFRLDKDFAYANDSRYWVHKQPPQPSPWFRRLLHFIASPYFIWILYIVFGALVVFLLYKIIVSNGMYLFYAAPKKVEQHENQESAESPLDIEVGLKKALAEGDWKLAVRFYYLKAIQVAADKNLIEYHIQATNQDYINQWKDQHSAADFRYLTYAFERVWYGGMNLDKERFRSIEMKFEHYFNLLRS